MTSGSSSSPSTLRPAPDARSLDLLLSAFQQSSHFTVLLSPDGTELGANPAALAVGGIEAAEVAGKRFWDAGWWPEDERARGLLPQLVAAAASCAPTRETVPAVGPRGAVVLDLSIAPVRAASGASSC